MTAETECKEVSGKQILIDAAMLAKNIGIYLVTLGKRLFADVKRAFKTEDKDENQEKRNRV